MKSERLREFFDWIFIFLTIGTVMYMGKTRVHQLALNRFLLLGFGGILFLLIVYRVVCIRLNQLKQ